MIDFAFVFNRLECVGRLNVLPLVRCLGSIRILIGIVVSVRGIVGWGLSGGSLVFAGRALLVLMLI